MKQVLIAIIFLSTFSANAQIQEVDSKSKYQEIGKVGGGRGPFVSSLSILKCEDETNSYLWMYNNLKYTSITDIKSITFKATELELQKDFEIELKVLNEIKEAISKNMDLMTLKN